MKKQPAEFAMINIMANPKYKGRHIILVKDKVFTAKTGRQASKILDMVEKEFPHEIPEITYIPKADTLILWL